MEINMEKEFLPDSYEYVYTMECSETIARMVNPGIYCSDVDIVFKEAKRNLDWVIKMHPIHNNMDERESYDFFYTCGLLYFTFSALSKKKDVQNELETLKSLLQDAIQKCRQFKSFSDVLEFDESIEGSGEFYEKIRNFWNWEGYISDYDTVFHIDPYSEYQLKCRSEYESLYKTGTCSEETYGFNLFVMMSVADKWPDSEEISQNYKEDNWGFCHWCASSSNQENYEKVFNNFIVNYYYSYCDDQRDTKANLYNFCNAYDCFNWDHNINGRTVDEIKRDRIRITIEDDYALNPEQEFLFTTIANHRELCTWSIYDSIFKDTTHGLENLINTVFGELYGGDKKTWGLQIFEDIRTDYHNRYKQNPGIVICLFYLVRNIELFDFESLFSNEGAMETSYFANMMKECLKGLPPNSWRSKSMNEKYVFAKNTMESKEIDKNDDLLISMMLYFAVWEFLGSWKNDGTYLHKDYGVVSNRKLLLPMFYEGFLKKDFDYIKTLQAILNKAAEYMNFNKEDSFEGLDLSDRTARLRIIHSLSKVYTSNKDAIINLMQFVHEMQMRNYPLFVDTKTVFNEPNIPAKLKEDWDKNMKKTTDTDFGFNIPYLYQSFAPFNNLMIKYDLKSRENIPGVYGEHIETIKTKYDNTDPILIRNINCKFMLETDKKIKITISKNKDKLWRHEDYEATYVNTIKNHYMYDDRSMSVHERVLKSIKELTEENKVRDLIAYLYKIRQYLVDLLNSGNLRVIGISCLIIQLDTFVAEIIMAIRPQKDFDDVWKECLGPQGEPNLTNQELEKFSMQVCLGNQFIFELQDFLGIITTTKGIVDSKNRTTDFISLYSTQIVVYLIYLAFAFQPDKGSES